MASLSQTLIAMGVPERFALAARGPIGRGTEGVVYKVSPSRILKVNVKAPRTQSVRALQKRVKGRAWAAKIYECGRLQPRGFWYTSDLLYPLSSAEQANLDRLGFAIMAAAKGAVDPRTAERIVARCIAEAMGPLRATIRRARAAGYHDLHGRNIMKTADGKYKVVDVESLRPLPKRPKGAR